MYMCSEHSSLVQWHKAGTFNRCTVHWQALATQKVNPILHGTPTPTGAVRIVQN